MDKGSTNSEIPEFEEIVRLLDKKDVKTMSKKMNANRYTKRLDAYLHLVILLYTQLGQFVQQRKRNLVSNVQPHALSEDVNKLRLCSKG